MPWWIPAILTAFLWGVSYTALEQVIKYIDKTTYIFLSSFLFLGVYGFLSWNHVSNDLITLSHKSSVIFWVLLASVSSILGNYLALLAIEHSNASLAAALEISYPFWGMLIAWLFFNQTMTSQVMFGSIVIFMGVYLIATGK